MNIDRLARTSILKPGIKTFAEKYSKDQFVQRRVILRGKEWNA